MSRKSLSIKADGKAIDLAELQTALQSLPHYFIPHESKGSRNLSDYLPIRCPSSGQTKANRNYRNSLFYYNHGQAVEGGEKAGDEFRIVLAENTTARLPCSYSAMLRSFRK